MKKILVSINGLQDPFSGSHGGPPSDGPILSLLEKMPDFDEVVLFYTPNNAEAAVETKSVITQRNPAIEIRPVELEGLDDPTNYEQILTVLRSGLARFCPPSSKSRYWVSVSSGTSQMHACWLLLTASGEFSATVIQVREERLVKEGQPLISEINPRVTEYPLVRPYLTMETIPQISPRQVEEAMADCGILTSDPKMKAALEQAAKTAQHEYETILVTGPTGTGKELMARFIHKVGKRRKNEFRAVNCGALTENLIENELFGHTKGAFTGADKDKIGIIEACDKGIVFLDEIGEMPIGIQTRLLRVLEQREVTPVGSTETRPVDVQFVAATNRDLREAVRQKLFREDLYYRLSAHIITLPPLKDRRDDIPEIAAKLLSEFNSEYDKRPLQRFTPGAIDKLRRHHWPGNVRELKNVVKRAAVNCPAGEIDTQQIHLQNIDRGEIETSGLPEPAEGFKLEDYLDAVRCCLYKRALELTDGNGSRAAAILGVTAQAVHKYRKNRDAG